jgi:hypothetical protein
MSGLLAAPFLASAALLVVAGVPKVRDPLPLVRAVRTAGLPLGRTSVRVLAALEVLVGVWAVAAPGRLVAGLVAAAYLVFTAFVLWTLRRGGFLTSCGCFGKADTPPTRSHAFVTGAAAVGAALVAADPAAGTWLSSTTSAGDVAGTLALAGLLGFLAWQVLAVLPTTAPAAIRSIGKG